MRKILVCCLTTIISALFCFSTLEAQSITAVYAPTSVASGGGTDFVGTPFALFVRIQGWTAAANSQAYVKLYSSSYNEFMWSSSGVWSDSNKYAFTNQPVVNIDASGNWSGWIYAKHKDLLGSTPSLRAAKVGTTATNVTKAMSLTILNMSTAGNGGWIVRPSSPAANKAILAYSGGSVVGTYRTEDNAIAEGYSFGNGGFKIAVPAGVIDSLVTIDDAGMRDTAFTGPWIITAGSETDATLSGGLAGIGSASIIPGNMQGGLDHNIEIKLNGEPGSTITNAQLVVPSSWTWSHSATDVAAAGTGTPLVNISGDTIRISGSSVGNGDSLTLQISHVTPPDVTAAYRFSIATGSSPDSVYPMSAQPSIFVFSTPLQIQTVKQNDAAGLPLLNNQMVTVRGIITVAGQFGSPSSVQDNTGGLAVYGWDFSHAVTVGDEVIVSGLVQPFKGLTELVNPLLQQIVSHGNTVVPLTVSTAAVAGDGVGGVEAYEGLLVRLNGVSVTGSGVWQANTNYTISDGTGSAQLRIDDSTNIVGAPIPAGTFDLVGVVGQYVNASPWIGGYQIMPRSKDDIISSGPLFATSPVESHILPGSLTISWSTIYPGTTGIRYGKSTALELGQVGNDSLRIDHQFTLSGLDPATVYYLGAFSAAAGDTSFASPLIASTASPAGSSGRINAYFNKTVDTTLSWDQTALGNQDLVGRIITRISSAHRSVDAALYSLSGTPGPGSDVAAALVAAKSRGVSVRVICEDDNSTTSPFTTLRNSGITVVTDRFDQVNAGAGLMHNKFFVVDGRGGAAESVWVWTGSWNVTDPGTNNDYQNAIEVQDLALAGAYTMEFNEMWGSASTTPNQSLSRFGARKTDNTPHRFVIGGKEVECYFSPSDRAASHVVAAIVSAQHSVAFSMLTLTREDIAGALAQKKAAGRKVRGVMDNGTDQGSEYTYMLGQGVDVLLKPTGTSGLLHHKYGIIDGENPAWNPLVITGSYNWTGSGESSNNENVLFVRDGTIANMYLQEFGARYAQFGGADPVTVGVENTPARVPRAFALEQNFPNPFNPTTTIAFSLPRSSNVRLLVFDVLGREVATLQNGPLPAGDHRLSFDASRLASGVYVYRIEADDFRATKKMVLVR